MSEGLRRVLMSLAAAVAVAAVTALFMLWFGRPLYYSDGQVATFGASAELREAPMVRFARPGPIVELGGSVSGRVATLPDGSLLYGLVRGEARTELVRLDPRRAGAPEPVLALRSEGHDLSPSLAPDGGGIYFTSDRPHRDGGGYDLWWARYREGEIYAPQPLPAPINTIKDEADPEVDAQSGMLLFARRDASADARGVFTLLQAPLAPDADVVATPLWPRRANDFAWQREVAVAADGKSLWFVQQDGLTPPLLMRAWRHAGAWLAPTRVVCGDEPWRAPRIDARGRSLQLLDASRGLLYAAPAVDVFPWWEGQQWLERLLLMVLAVAMLVWSLLALGRRWRALDTVTWCILLSLLLHLAILAWLRSVEIVRRFELPPPRLGELEVSLVAGGASGPSVAEANAAALANELRFASQAQAIAAATPEAAVAEATPQQVAADSAREVAAPAPQAAPTPAANLRDAAAELAQRQARAQAAQLAAQQGEALLADQSARAEAARRELGASNQGLVADVPRAQAVQAQAGEPTAAPAAREGELPRAQPREATEPTLADAAAEQARRQAAAPAARAPEATPLPTLAAQSAPGDAERQQPDSAPLPTLVGPGARLPNTSTPAAASAAPILTAVTPQRQDDLSPALRDRGEPTAARAARAVESRALSAVPSGALAAADAKPVVVEHTPGPRTAAAGTLAAPASALSTTAPPAAAVATPEVASSNEPRPLPTPAPELRDVTSGLAVAANAAPSSALPVALVPTQTTPLAAPRALPSPRPLPTPNVGGAAVPATVRAPGDLLASATPVVGRAPTPSASAPQARVVAAPPPALRDGEAGAPVVAAAPAATVSPTGVAPLVAALEPTAALPATRPTPAPTVAALPGAVPVLTGPADLMAAAPQPRVGSAVARPMTAPGARALAAPGPRLRDLDSAPIAEPAAAEPTSATATRAASASALGEPVAALPAKAVALLRRDLGFAALSRGIRPPDSLLPLADASLSARDALVTVAALPDLYRSRFGPQKLAALEAFGGSEQTEAAVQKGLQYLASIQRNDGAWGRRRNPHEKYGEVWVGKSALCVLAFLGAGHTHQGGTEHARAVGRALDWLIAQQDPDTGHFGETSAYSHGITTYALAECYALTKDAKLRPSIDKAVGWILRNQNRGRDRRNSGGWGYFSPTLRPEDRFARTSVSAWMVMALKSAQLSGLAVPELALADAEAFLWRMFDEEMGYFLYSKDPARLESSWRTLPGSTPASAFCLSLMGADPQDRRMRAAWAFTLERAPRAYRRYDTDAFVLQGAGNVYFWYYGSLSCFLAGGEVWATWNEALKRVLLDGQSDDGSFEPIDEYASYAGDTDRDRAYTTAMCVLSLEVYYRYFTPLVKPR